jgi:DNA-nicking Smr family endonuclease
VKPPRGLTPDEAALWARLAATVRPLRPSPAAPPAGGPAGASAAAERPAVRVQRRPAAVPPPRPSEARRPLDRHTLDGTWDRKLASGIVQPDFTLDLHGHTLGSAHARLDYGLAQAAAQGARVLLLITGKPRPSEDHAAPGSRRGAIRATVLDWLAAGPHASRIAAVRPAHPRHGGAGALYIVLKRG